MSQLQTRIGAITERRLVEEGPGGDTGLDDGEVLLRVERFAFTSNNVTYAAVGEQVGYWQFFPPAAEPPQRGDWGIIPAWGYANVVQSRHREIAGGERVYGYLPMADHWIMRPERATAQSWVDGSSHRSGLPAVYNQYQRVPAGETGHRRDNFTALLKPLFGTAYCLCDDLERNAFYGATQLLIPSASSKTSLGLAYGLSRILEGGARRVVGITSAANRDFVASLGLYDEVVTYDDLAAIDADEPAVIVDMSGDRAVLGALHQRLGESMRWCHNVGLTHWEGGADGDPDLPPLIRERSALFFAPAHMQARAAELGAAAWNRRLGDFVEGALVQASDWLEVREIAGLEAFLPVYDEVVAGRLEARAGLIVLP